MRNKFGCYLDSPVDHDVMQNEMIYINRAQMADRFDAIKKKVHASQLIKNIANRQFDFVFKGHHYTIRDSARDQGECPHCGKRSIGNMYEFIDDGFIGWKKIDKLQSVLCFECSNCFE